MKKTTISAIIYIIGAPSFAAYLITHQSGFMAFGGVCLIAASAVLIADKNSKK